MLILTRRVGEAIRIGNEVEVVVAQAHGNQVRLGINAPREIEIYRSEVFDRLCTEHVDDSASTTS